jgi:iron complex transport system ATP-binding protein
VTALVEFRDVDFAYPSRGGGASFAIRALSLSVGAGEIFGVIGPNASGKTTLVRLLTKVLAPGRGDVRLAGESLARLSRASVATRVAVVPQDLPRGLPYTVEELVLMGRFPHAPARFFESDEDLRLAREAMAATGVLAVRAAAVDDLSGGERQRAMLARALCQQSPLLVLDEPTAHLDLRYQAECVGLLRRFNREAGLTVILISHDLNLAAELCDRLLLMQAGTAAALGSVDHVVDEERLSSVYGCRVSVDKHPSTGRPTVQIVWPDSDGR